MEVQNISEMKNQKDYGEAEAEEVESMENKILQEDQNSKKGCRCYRFTTRDFIILAAYIIGFVAIAVADYFY